MTYCKSIIQRYSPRVRMAEYGYLEFRFIVSKVVCGPYDGDFVIAEIDLWKTSILRGEIFFNKWLIDVIHKQYGGDEEAIKRKFAL